MSTDAYIGFGSNMGDRNAAFDNAVKLIGDLPETTVRTTSMLYETAPVGLSDAGPDFLNAVIAVQTGLSAEDLWKGLQSIERILGKSPDHRSDLSRAIDLDLLLYGDERIERDGIEVPHPRMHERAFVLVPLARIAPDIVHPTLGCSIRELHGRLTPEQTREVTLTGNGAART